MAEKSTRIASIDVFRALTMLLMIWVNDFWSLENIPKWLQHAASGEDYLGFSDLIFPWFLFIVGLSIPFAIENRLKKGDSQLSILYHILIRSIALLVMGFFHVNFPGYNAAATGMSKALFTILCTLAFFLVWNRYPRISGTKKYVFAGLQVLGILLLVIMAIIYKGAGIPPGWMKVQWWGILGLIGWTYIIAAPVYLIFRKKVYIIGIFLGAFIALNIMADTGIAYNIFSWQGGFWLPGNGSNHVLGISGILISVLLQKYSAVKKRKELYIILYFSAIIAFCSGIILHQHIPISKISASSTWVMFSLASGVALFAFLHWLVDHRGKAHWFSIIKTAGTATLTCYLLPYFYYSFRTLLHIDFDGFIVNGAIGLTKSMVFAFIIVGVTWLLGRLKIQLKI